MIENKSYDGRPDIPSALWLCEHVPHVVVGCRYGRNEWRDDMKKLLKRAGLDAKQTVFLFTDTQIVHETFLEVHTVPTTSLSQDRPYSTVRQ